MPLRSALPLVSLTMIVGLVPGLVLLGTGATAADLPAHSRLGAIFAEPAAPAPVIVEPPLTVPLLPYVAGYYGPHYGAFRYRTYYGTSPIEIFSRYPYTCLSYACSP